MRPGICHCWLTNDPCIRTEAYGYDALSRLIGVDYEYSGGTPVFDDAWWYDPAGNRQPAANHSYNVYNAANMLTQTGASYYTNDLNGNTLTGGGRTNIWDSQSRLASCTFVDGSTTYRSRFAYGPDGLRRQQESLDSNGIVIAEAGEPDENGNPIKGMRNYGPWGGSTESGTLLAPLAYILVSDAFDHSGIFGELIEFEAGRVARASA